MSSVSAKIGVEGLRVPCVIGCQTWERDTVQEVTIDLQVEADVSRCVVSDSLEDTIDYRSLIETAIQVCQEGKYKMIEALAWNVLLRVAEQCQVTWGWIRVHKPQALVGHGSAVVEMEWGKRST